MRRISTFVLLLGLAANASLANAHHVTGPPPRQGGDLDAERGALGVDASSTSVGLANGERVDYMTLAASALLRLGSLTLGMRMPLHHVTASDPRTGPGDLTLRTAYDLVRKDRFRLSAKLALQLPTGNAERFLGYGSAAILPTLRATLQIGDIGALFVRGGGVFDAVDTRSVDPIDQRVGSELRGAMGAHLPLKRWRATTEIFAALPTSGEGKLLLFSPGATYDVNRNLQVGLYAQLPLLSERAFDWRAGASCTYRWGKASESASGGDLGPPAVGPVAELGGRRTSLAESGRAVPLRCGPPLSSGDR